MFELERSLESPARHRRWGLIGLAAAPLLSALLYRQGYHLPLQCPILALT
ncbi:MAG: hypothetical protein F6K28_59755, partial [Microcoleus sp. SIO2G3]|nr:hypothetical protein [Microcoleus sp. SIO2G3]